MLRINKEQKRREEEERKRKMNEPVRFAKSKIEQIVAKEASESSYDDPWKWLDDLARHGCSSGMVSGLIYYNETSKFYQEHKTEIWEQLAEDADSHGTSIMEMLGEIQCFRENVTDEDTFENYMAWYAYEAAAQALIDRHENPESYGYDDEDDDSPTPNLDIEV